MKMNLNFGAAEVPLMDEASDAEFSFSVEFDNGARFEATYEPDIAKDDDKMVICSLWNRNDTLLQRRVVRS